MALATSVECQKLSKPFAIYHSNPVKLPNILSHSFSLDSERNRSNCAGQFQERGSTSSPQRTMEPLQCSSRSCSCGLIILDPILLPTDPTSHCIYHLSTNSCNQGLLLSLPWPLVHSCPNECSDSLLLSLSLSFHSTCFYSSKSALDNAFG